MVDEKSNKRYAIRKYDFRERLWSWFAVDVDGKYVNKVLRINEKRGFPNLYDVYEIDTEVKK